MASARKQKQYRKAIERGLTKAFEAAGDPVDVDVADLRWIVFSDHHKGERDGADDFRRCERTYNAALAAYLERGYTLVTLGDVEELWECTPAKVLQEYEHTLSLEREFHDAGRTCGSGATTTTRGATRARSEAPRTASGSRTSAC